MLTLARIWRTQEVRKSVLFVLGLFLLYRLVAHIPVPGIDPSALASFFQSNQLFGLLNVFSGGSFQHFSLVALGVAPYITSSIIFQLLGMMIPRFEEMQKEEQGRQKINQWSRLLTVPFALLQGYGLMAVIQQQTGFVIEGGTLALILALLSMTAGTIFMMWLGELISEKKIGNGISLMIFAGIVASLPSFFQQSLSLYNQDQLITTILFLGIVLITIAGVVLINEGQRQIPVKYARQMTAGRHSSGGGVTTHLPLRINMAGVIPVIFAVSLIVFPSVIAQFFVDAKTPFLRSAATLTLQLFGNQWFYGVLYFLLVFAFTFFYASVIFHPDQISENLQKQAGFIPGIRPGLPTAEYLSWVLYRVLPVGAFFLGIIAILPFAVQGITGQANLIVGGTSILIVVAVLIDSVKQMEAQLSMREYDQ